MSYYEMNPWLGAVLLIAPIAVSVLAGVILHYRRK